ncbi:MAG: hypothetical protein Q8P67_23695 [archaeon]|nr:hypothetical protein [archaeon]
MAFLIQQPSFARIMTLLSACLFFCDNSTIKTPIDLLLIARPGSRLLSRL